MLENMFDGVVMLTWSDWKTEARSNRYHYASRFARHLPVLFVQPDQPGDLYRLEATELPGITVARIPSDFSNPIQASRLGQAMAAKGISKPLFWVYNFNFVDFVAAQKFRFVVYHATEDYFTPLYFDKETCDPAKLKRLLALADTVVAVSQGVMESCLGEGRFKGEALVAPNGVDYAFYAPSNDAVQDVLAKRQSRTVLYQGGINIRLDFDLLEEVIRVMPEYEFHFAGTVPEATVPDFARLQAHANVRYLGRLTIEEVRDEMRRATVGVIPFVQDHYNITRMRPLKSFEYVASGLPVVAVPIESLKAYPELFRLASSPEAFVEAIRRASAKALDPNMFRLRLAAAREEDYDTRFVQVIARIADVGRAKTAA